MYSQLKQSKSLHIVSFLFFIQFSFGQNNSSKTIRGQITKGESLLENVSVLNTATQEKIFSDQNGIFTILVNQDDVLVFSSLNLETIEYRIRSNDLKNELLNIKMTAKENKLKEVVVNNNAHITAENLGIIPKGQKKYTPAERKLAVAGDFKPIMLLGLLGGSMQLDPLLNKINGRTKRLKGEILLEQKEINIKKLGELFEDSYFVDYLKIPADYIKSFKFYLVENESVAALLKVNDITGLTPLMSQMALKFNEINTIENK
ncbi:MAG: hypothetical protein EOO44_08850 [Flavobacterium sp.]|nr:MAG: hypothetical protein EOO44_08850 [Flavobacterium sp.]